MGYKLSEIVEEKLIEMGEGQSNKFSRFYQFGLSFLRQKNLTTTGFPKIIELTISSVDTAPLPLDYLQYTRIGLCVNGIIYSLGRNENLCLNPLFDSCGNPIAHGILASSSMFLCAGITLGPPATVAAPSPWVMMRMMSTSDPP